MTHSTAQIIQYLIIQLTEGTLPSNSLAWPIYRFNLPNTPDNCGAVFDTTNITQSRSQINGEYAERLATQLQIRGNSYQAGKTKIEAIAKAFDEDVYNTIVTIDSTSYLIQNVGRTSGVLSLGKDEPNSNNYLFTLNNLSTITEL
jgi:hypothetical protein